MARSLLLTAVGSVGGRVVGLVALLMALGWVDPVELGLASLVLAIIAVLRGTAELSLGAALVQAETIETEEIDALFWLSLAASVVAAAAVALAAPGLATLFGSSELVGPLRVAAAVLPLGALAMVPRAQLERRLQMGRLALVDNAGTVVGAIVLVVLAWRGAGVWAFVLAELANRSTQTAAAFVASPHRPSGCGRSAHIGPRLRFGLFASGSRLLHQLYVNADYLVVGAMLSPHALGLYAFAYRIVFDPTRGLTNVIGRVAFPALSRLHDDPARVHRYLGAFARLSVGGIGVLLVTGAIEIDRLLPVLGYERWDAAVPLVRILAGLALLQTATPLLPQLLNALGRARDNFVYSAVCATVMPLAFVVGASVGGSVGVAVAWLVGYPVVASLLLWLAARALASSPWTLLATLGSGVWVVGLAAMIGLGMRFALPGLPMIAALAITVATSIAVVFARERGRWPTLT